MERVPHWKYTRVRWVQGEEAICVACGNNNAMLRTGSLGTVSFYECRDCHAIVAVERDSILEKVEGKHVVREGRTIARSLGKTCSNCHSFDVEWGVRDVPREDLSRKYEDKSGYWCNDCGQFWGT